MLMEKKYWLYVLKLEQGKYYVGVTARNVSKRVEEHKHGFMGAKWTKKYKPVKILDKKDLGLMTFEKAEKYETRVTIKYMDKYGVNNVRGGLLTYEGNYKRRFGRYFEDDDYQNLKGVIFMMAIIFFLGVMWYLK
jgi:predicted GIY-YIG superfamily endonuclease